MKQNELKYPRSDSDKYSNFYSIHLLRSIAVSCVLLYHMDFVYFKYGYLGVDVFFVISGFLIANIADRREIGSIRQCGAEFTLRMKRLVPALSFCIFFVILASIFISTPQDFKDTSQSVVASYLFFSNIYYFYTINYFSQASDSIVLLHLWSVSIEVQFYVLIFTVLLLMKKGRCSLKVRFFIMSLLTVASLSLYLWAMNTYEMAAFYLPFARFWQFCCGFIIFFWVTGRFSRIQNINLAIILIIISYISIESQEYNILCVIVSMIYIVISTQFRSIRNFNLKVGFITSHVSRISYSIYLIHWPMIVFAKQLNLFYENKLAILSMVYIVSLIISRHIEYSLVYSGPGGAASAPKNKLRIAMQIVIIPIIGISISCATHYSDGFPGRVSKKVYELDLLARKGVFESLDSASCLKIGTDRNQLYECRSESATDSRDVDVLLIGDSHAAHYFHGITKSMDPRLNILAYWRPGCPFMLTDEPANMPSTACASYNRRLFQDKIIDRKYNTIIISNAWAKFLDLSVSTDNYLMENLGDVGVNDPVLNLYSEVSVTVSHLQSLANKIIVIGPTPEFLTSIPTCLARAMMHSIKIDSCEVVRDDRQGEYSETLGRYIMENASYNEKDPKIMYVDMYSVFCVDGGRCTIKGDGAPFFADDDHLSRSGSEYAVMHSGLAGPFGKDFLQAR